MLVDIPFLSYIDVQHANFLPPSSTTGKARDLSPRYTTAKNYALVKDKSAKRVSQSRKVHILVEEPEATTQPTEPKAIKAHQDAEMVTKRKMTVNRFLLSTRPTT